MSTRPNALLEVCTLSIVDTSSDTQRAYSRSPLTWSERNLKIRVPTHEATSSRVEKVPTPDETLICGLTVREPERAVLVQGHAIPLTPREFEIVARLADHPGWVISADQLAEESGDQVYSPESVTVHVSRLRRKLACAGAPEAIETIRGFGYRLRSSDPTGAAHEPADSERARALRDASWQLTEAVLEVEHSGSSAQLEAAREALGRARQSIYAVLAQADEFESTRPERQA